MSDAPRDNAARARVLAEVAQLLELQGANPFRVRSYRIAAEAVEAHGEPVTEMIARGADLRATLEIGPGLEAKLREVAETGDCGDRRALLEQVPGGLLRLLRIPGLGPKGVARLWKELGVTSAAELEAALDAGRLRELKGMGEKKQASLRRGLERLKQSSA